MTRESIKTLSDQELSQVVAWAREEETSRAVKCRHDTITRIKELARAVGVSVTINRKQGGPLERKSE